MTLPQPGNTTYLPLQVLHEPAPAFLSHHQHPHIQPQPYEDQTHNQNPDEELPSYRDIFPNGRPPITTTATTPVNINVYNINNSDNNTNQYQRLDIESQTQTQIQTRNANGVQRSGVGCAIFLVAMIVIIIVATTVGVVERNSSMY